MFFLQPALLFLLHFPLHFLSCGIIHLRRKVLLQLLFQVMQNGYGGASPVSRVSSHIPLHKVGWVASAPVPEVREAQLSFPALGTGACDTPAAARTAGSCIIYPKPFSCTKLLAMGWLQQASLKCH